MKKTLGIIGSIALLGGVIYFAAQHNKYQNSTVGKIEREPANSSFAPSVPSLPSAVSDEGSNPESITLTSSNSVVFREAVDEQSIAKLQTRILEKTKKLGNKPLYLVLDTPGGSIPAGYDLIDMIKGMKLNVKTITQFSASMGAYIAMTLGERLVTPHGVYMFHRATVGGVGGQIPGEFLTRAGYLLNLVTVMEKQNASRLGISMEEYTKLVKDEYWVSGEEAVKQGVADRVVTIACDESLQGTYTENVQVMFFNLDVTYSKCPAVRGPLGISVKNSTGDIEQDNEIINEFINKRGKSRYTDLQ